MSPYRIAPAAAAPPPKRSAVVRLWRMGHREGGRRVIRFWCAWSVVAFTICLPMALLALPFTAQLPLSVAIGFVSLGATETALGYLRLRRVRAALAPCPTHRALGKHGRCGHYACCYECFRKDCDDVMALGERSADLQREAVARLTRYQATTETRERARYTSGATAAVAEARDRRKRIR